MLLGKFKISGHSMTPTFKNNETVLISDIFYIFKHPLVNDIVGFKFDNQVLIKRIKKIKNNQYFMQGDNKIDSFDSRKFGFISRENIIGKVFYKLS